MEGKEADLVDPFFDSEEDEPVDMEMVFEAMKHVPLPDIDYPEQDDPISGDPCAAETLQASSLSLLRDRIPQGVLKRKAISAKGEPAKKKGVGATERPQKRVKVEVISHEPRSKLSPKQPVKAENLVGSVRSAQAKVAAEVAPNVFTGGIVAESGPRPDFSLWTVDDDLLLKNAMEAGAAMEALGKGAMRFSRRFTVRELRERWRALLYDPEIAAQAAARMVEAELAVSNIEGPKIVSEQNNPLELARKRRANSIRTLYYKKRRKVLTETVPPGSANGLVGNDLEDVFMPGMGFASDMPGDHGSKHFPHLDFMAMGLMDTHLLESLSPKETTSLDSDDQSFSQMFSLLATGGVRAVIGALPAGLSMDTLEQDLGVMMDDMHSRGTMAAETDDMFNTGRVKGEEAGDTRGENEQLTSAMSEPHLRQSMVIHTHPCESDEDEATITIADIEMDARLQASNDCSKVDSLGAGNDMHFDGANAEGYAVSAGLHMDESALNGHLKDQTIGGYAPSYRDSHLNTVSGVTSVSEYASVDGELESITHLKSNSNAKYASVKAEIPCETSSVSVMDHRDGVAADTKLSCLSPIMRADPPLSEVTDNTQRQEHSPWASVDAEMDVHLEEYDKLEEDVECCECGRIVHYVADPDESREDYTSNDQCYVGEEQDNFLPSVLTGESCTLDLDHRHGENFDQGYCTIPASVGLENPVCTLNTEDNDDIPNLDDVLPYPPSPSLPSSPSEDEYLAMLESPIANAGPEGDGDADVEAEGAREHHVDEYMYVGSPLRVDAAIIKHEPEIFDTYGNPIHDPTKLGSFVDRSGVTMVTSDKVERAGEVATAYQDEAIDFRNADLMSCPVSNTHVSSMSEQCLPCSPIIANRQQQSLHMSVDGNLQPANSGRAVDCQTIIPYTPQCPPNLASRQVEMVSLDGETGNLEPDFPTLGDLPPVIPPIEQVPANRESSKLALEPPEEVLDSDEEMVRFSDIEAMILDMDLDADDEFSARAESRRTYRRHGRAFVRLEQAASAAMQRSLNVHGALAVLYGRHFKYYITQTEVMMGRATSDNAVDIDLGKEGRANKVSRQQANIKLKDDGVFYLRNLGRRGLTVNNKAVETGQRAILGSSCLIEVGGMRFIFEINRKLVKEYIERRHHEQ
ncbi:microspherule protein 1 [Marchantia polymorpha subsp. ruderalis]|uniref:FHA domain-containing protein n=2 Tax=Marchantia polymorpha TaxID=3197 RepID=A0AAF6AM67_MARPO|nr:hypothetical protein MARPO_0043s0034 [Marchantia polymorpha]BBM97532.1 hypothetical protein Mp_1g06420 [Marchantia polymorpha subsp. ruderalis]PTQ39772.1 hypothetical protein MARPO_0043s0034 [Marchantia polymorpha]PTQ39773.1 hypothetical protein MARPO_0043s0034 [Marchantia polymorpha]PTQ39774.1 hypothetical protein MARPO_0043s0034 [Marchantia polymorpha]|eukprot:PTQ39771.1 hypothetical protein MARPO_0043s0034 [Marchantia polymorpha]